MAKLSEVEEMLEKAEADEKKKKVVINIQRWQLT